MKRARYIRGVCSGIMLLGVLSAHCIASPARTKVKIEATELDRRLLLERLNRNSKESFELSEDNFSYKIIFTIEQGSQVVAVNGLASEVNRSGAMVEVQDPAGKTLFRFRREGRGTDKGAANAAAKEIIKRLRTISSEPQSR